MAPKQGQDDGQGGGQGQDGGQGGGTDTALAGRVDTIEAEQTRQGGVIDQILTIVQGNGGQGASGGQGGAQGQGDVTYADIPAQIQKGIADAEERRRAEDEAKGQADWRDSVTADLEKLKAESVPREPTTGLRGRVQRAMFGRDE